MTTALPVYDRVTGKKNKMKKKKKPEFTLSNRTAEQ